MERKRLIKKINPDSTRWEGLANKMARSFTRIIACHDCGYPVVHGYCCKHCGSTNPEGAR